VKRAAALVLPAALVTVTLTAPAGRDGVTKVSEPSVTPDGVTVSEPMVTLVADSRSVPVSVTVVPPRVLPAFGFRPLTTGAGMG
jgi:hypothetical protein